MSDNSNELGVGSSSPQKIPFQLDLAGIGVKDNDKFGQMVTLHDQVQHYTRNESALIIPVEETKGRQLIKVKHQHIDGVLWELETKPALIKTADGREVFRYPGTREERVMEGLKRLSQRDPLFIASRVAARYFLADLLGEISKDGEKQRLSYPELRESLSVLRAAQYKLSCGFDGSVKQSWDYSLIGEVLTSEETECAVEDIRSVVIFSSLMTRKILALDFRLWNTEVLNNLATSLAPEIYRQLCLYFRNAAEGKYFDLWINPIRKAGEFPIDDSLSITRRRLPFVNALNDLINNGVIKTYELIDEKKGRVTGADRKRSRIKVLDELYRIYPSPDFVNDQKKSFAVRNEIRKRFELAQEQGVENESPDHPTIRRIKAIKSDQINAMVKTDREVSKAQTMQEVLAEAPERDLLDYLDGVTEPQDPQPQDPQPQDPQ